MINQSNRVFIDNTSLAALAGIEKRPISSWQDINPNYLDIILQMLEAIVIYDELHVDGFVLSKNNRAAQIAKLLKSVVVPRRYSHKMRFRAALQACKIVNLIPSLNEFVGQNNILPWKTDSFDLFTLRSMMDEFLAGIDDDFSSTAIDPLDLVGHISHVRIVLESSTALAERTLVYYFMSRASRLSYVPHVFRTPLYRQLLLCEEAAPHRSDEFQNEEEYSSESVSSNVVKYVKKHCTNIRRKQRGILFPVQSIDLDVSPVSALVLQEGCKSRINLLSAALRIRESKEARSFRKWCAQIISLAHQGKMKSVDREARKLKAKCDEWASGADLDLARHRKITIGKLVKTDLVIKDPIIPPLRFISPKNHWLFLHQLVQT